MSDWKIRTETLKLIFEICKNMHPKEFGGFLRADKSKKLITELILSPKFETSEVSALHWLYMLPAGLDIVGTVHSHPNRFNIPSSTDLEFFTSFYGIHIIVCYPYTINSWQGYDTSGKPIIIEPTEQ